MAKKIKSRELGFGTLASSNGQRFMNKDGTANVARIGGTGSVLPIYSISLRP